MLFLILLMARSLSLALITKELKDFFVLASSFSISCTVFLVRTEVLCSRDVPSRKGLDSSAAKFFPPGSVFRAWDERRS